MKEYIVTGTKKGRREMVRLFAQNAGQAAKKARDEHGFASHSSVKEVS